jgi:hypothetical protein
MLLLVFTVIELVLFFMWLKQDKTVPLVTDCRVSGYNKTPLYDEEQYAYTLRGSHKKGTVLWKC